MVSAEDEDFLSLDLKLTLIAVDCSDIWSSRLASSTQLFLELHFRVRA